MRLEWTRKAIIDRRKIIRFIARDNHDAAKSMYALFLKSAKGLLQFPYKGKCGRVTGTREVLAHTNYILIYMIDGDVIRILTILHVEQKYPPE